MRNFLNNPPKWFQGVLVGSLILFTGLFLKQGYDAYQMDKAWAMADRFGMQVIETYQDASLSINTLNVTEGF